MKKLILIFTLFVYINNSCSQNIDVKWSEQFIYDNKRDGFFEDYLGTNDSYVYAKFSDLNFKEYGSKRDTKNKIIAFDKNTMQIMGEIELKGYSKVYQKFDYYNAIILDDIIYVLWTKKTKQGVVELYAQSYNNRLKNISKLSKIYEISAGKAGYDNLIIIYNRKLGNKILIAKEFEATKDHENLRIEYKLINSDFSLVNSKQLKLPVLLLNKRRRRAFSPADNFKNNVCSYELADDGKLYIQNIVRSSDEEKARLNKGEASVYPHLIQVDLESGDMQEYRLKFPQKNTFNFSSLISANGIKLYGFFSDLNKDEKGRDTHGLFLISLNSNNFNNVEMKFSYFEKPFLDELYAADRENQKKGGGLFKSKKAIASDIESLDDNYIIEKVLEDGTDLILFCSIMRNWSETYCSNNSCQTSYYCEKSNVTAFKLDRWGDIKWARNMDRKIVYKRWNVYDLNVVKKDDDYYVVYGSAYQTKSKNKNLTSKKSRAQQTDRLEYAVFSGKTGDYKKNEYQVNKLGSKKKDAKFIKPDNIVVFDNKMYTSSVKTQLKPIAYFTCPCPFIFMFIYTSRTTLRKGRGHMGTITPL